ncbi:MAG: TolC family protein, partial [Candidatus Dadabacteria bacterium]|nr:TolC family protein [Candidatus Dadabacteria bacterium]
MIKTLLLIFFTMTGAAGALDLSVQEAISIALENNRDIQIEKENVVVSEGEITTQKGIFDPILNISSLYNDGETPTVSTFIPRGTINQQDFNVTG